MCELYSIIEKLCEKKGVNITTMCRESGANRGTLTDLKMGRRKGVNAETAQKIASYFGVTVAYLLGEEDQKEKPTVVDGELTDGEKLLLDMFRRVPEDKQELVLQMIRVALGSQE